MQKDKELFDSMRNIVILNSLHFSYPLPILMRVSYNTLIVKQNTSDYYKYKQNFLKIALSQKHNTTIFSRSTSERYRSYYLQREAKELKQVWLISYPSLSLLQIGCASEKLWASSRFLAVFTIFVLLRLITMESLKELYKIGTGPSSSHTMGPKKAAEAFVKRASAIIYGADGKSVRNIA